MNYDQIIKKLDTPSGKIDVILDTDAFNEIDDQYAIAYMLLSSEKLNTLGICAAPFFNSHSVSAQDGMEKSYDEILKILNLMNRADLSDKVYKGSRTYLPDESTPVISEATQYIVEEAKKHSHKDPLYVVAIGAITNVASAILIDRETMVNNTVIVWLGGNALHWHNNKEFNLRQDIAGARVLFDCGVPLVILPCQGVVSAFRTTNGELSEWLNGQNALGTYLYENTVKEAESYAKGKAWSRCIWDVTAVAWLLNDNDKFMSSRIIPAPIPQYDGHYSEDYNRHPIRYVYNINRDALFTDLFNKIRNL